MPIFLNTLLISALFLIAVIDTLTLKIPNWLSLPLVVLGLVAVAPAGYGALLLHSMAALGAFAVMALLSLLYKAIRQQDGLGMGDAKLLAAFGAWLGPLWLAPIVFIASTLAIFFVLSCALLSDGNKKRLVPFGPFLSIAFIFAWSLDGLGLVTLRMSS